MIRSGKVRRAKLYFLRDRTGKSARIAEKIKKKIGIDIETKIENVKKESAIQEKDETLTETTKSAKKVEAPIIEKKAKVQKVEEKKVVTEKNEKKKRRS